MTASSDALLPLIPLLHSIWYQILVHSTSIIAPIPPSTSRVSLRILSATRSSTWIVRVALITRCCPRLSVAGKQTQEFEARESSKLNLSINCVSIRRHFEKKYNSSGTQRRGMGSYWSLLQPLQISIADAYEMYIVSGISRDWSSVPGIY